MTLIREEAYRTLDPTDINIAKSLDDYRIAVASIALDNNVSFYDRLFTLHATQTGEYGEYVSIDSIRHLQQATKKPVLIETDDGLAVGRLDATDPWSLLNIRRRHNNRISTANEISLVANFGATRMIDHTQRWVHESYGQSSNRSQIGAWVTEADASSLAVGLDMQPDGNENLWRRLDTAPTKIA